MLVMFLSFIAVVAAVLLAIVNKRPTFRCPVVRRHQDGSFRVAPFRSLLMAAVLAPSVCVVAGPQTNSKTRANDPPIDAAEAVNTDNIATAATSDSDESQNEDKVADVDSATTPDQRLIVITRGRLDQLIEASGGDIQAFDFSRLMQASHLVPLTENQSQALRPVLQTAASSVMLDQLFYPATIKAIQAFFSGQFNPDSSAMTDAEKQKNKQRDQFFEDYPWIRNPGIGQIVAKTRMIEADRPEEIASQVQQKIRESVASRIQELARKRFGIDKVDPSLLKKPFFHPEKTIVQSAPWEEYVGADGSRDQAMVQTYVLVELPNDEIENVMTGIRMEIQKKRLVILCLTVGLAWLGMAISSIAFRTYHTKSRLWKFVVIPTLCLAIVPCIAGACLMIGSMTA